MRANSRIFYYAPLVTAIECEEHREKLEAALSGKSANGDRVEKLRNYAIYSIRLNGKGRILFTLFQHSMLVLEILPNHEYDASRFLKKNVLKRFLETTKMELQDAVTDDDFEDARLADVEGLRLAGDEEIDQEIHWPVYEAPNTYIVFDKIQNQVFSLQLPFIIQGPPGSGKSCTAFNLLVQAALKAEQTQLQGEEGLENSRILYVTKSKPLTNEIKRQWEQHPQFHELNKYVEICSYQDVWEKQQNNRVNKVELDERAVFLDWFKNYSKRQDKFKLVFQETSEIVYQDFRIICGCDTLQDYLDIGQKQSFAHAGNRQLLWEAFLNWQGYLAKHPNVCLSFSRLSDQEIYTAVFVDETQDLSYLQIKNVLNLAKKTNKHKNIVFCIDHRQSLEDDNPKADFIKNLLYKEEQLIRIINLPIVYRSPKKVMELALVFNGLRRRLDESQKAESEIIIPEAVPEGLVYWNKTPPQSLEEWQQCKIQNAADVCVVTHPTLKQEAEERLGITQIFDAKTVKGLQFRIVVYYKPFHDPVFRDINSYLAPQEGGSEKKKAEIVGMATVIAEGFTITTRSTEVVYIIQATDNRKLGFLISQFSGFLTNSQPDVEKVISQTASTPIDWQRQAQALREKGLETEAQDIERKHGISQKPLVHVAENPEDCITTKNSTMPNQYPEVKGASLEPVVDLAVESAIVTAESLEKKQTVGFQRKKKLELRPSAGKTVDSNKKNTDEFILAVEKFDWEKAKQHHSLGADINAKTKSGNTALLCAVGKDNRQMVKYLIKREADINLPGTKQVTPLYLAAQNGYVEITKDLIGVQGINLNSRFEEDEATPLHIAAQAGHDKIVKLLINLKNIEVNARTKNGRTPLFASAQNGHVAVMKVLLSKSEVDVNAQAENGVTSLHIVLYNNRVDLATLLLQRMEIQVDLPNVDGETPLHYAVKHKHVEIVNFLLERKADVAARKRNGLTPLHMAAGVDCADIVKLLLKKINVQDKSHDWQDEDGATPLHNAASTGHVEIARDLIDAAVVDVNAQMKTGETALHVAAHAGKSGIVKLLLQKTEVQVNLQDKDGNTALHFAFQNKHFRIIFILLERVEIDVNLKNNNGFTPLHYAAQQDQVAIMKLLVREKSADINVEAQTRVTPLYSAVENGKLESVKFLLAEGANAHAVTELNKTLLHLAARHGHDEVMELLLTYKIDIDAREEDFGATALHLAVLGGNVKTIKLLLDKTANINAPAINKSTPLHVSAQKGFVEKARFLLENGAEINAQSEDKKTSLHYAALAGQVDMVKFLLENQRKIIEVEAAMPDLINLIFNTQGEKELNLLVILLNHEGLKKFDWNSRFAKNNTVLMMLCACAANLEEQQQSVTIAKILINEKNVDFKKTNASGNSVLIQAVTYRNFPMVNYLLENFWNEFISLLAGNASKIGTYLNGTIKNINDDSMKQALEKFRKDLSAASIEMLSQPSLPDSNKEFDTEENECMSAPGASQPLLPAFSLTISPALLPPSCPATTTAPPMYYHSPTPEHPQGYEERMSNTRPFDSSPASSVLLLSSPLSPQRAQLPGYGLEGDLSLSSTTKDFRCRLAAPSALQR